MRYTAIEYFTDNYDNGYAYNVGDVYPRQGYEPSESRINALSSGNNVRKRPVIKADEEVQEMAEAVAEVAAEETAVEPEKPKKRSRKRED